MSDRVMTFQKAQDKVAQKYGYKNWAAMKAMYSKEVWDIDKFIEESAVLYAGSKFNEACKKQCAIIESHLTNWVDNELDHDKLLYPSQKVRTAPKPKFQP